MKQKRLEIATLFATMNAIYGVTMNNDAVMYQADLLVDLDLEALRKAFTSYTKTNKTNRPPTVAHIREIVNPFVDDRHVAIELARKIDRAVSRYGWTWEHGYQSHFETKWDGGGSVHNSFKEAVICELGELGWHVICSRGGWQNTRNSSNEMEEGMFIAQMRDQIQASMSLQKAGADVSKILLPSTTKELQESQSSGLEKADRYLSLLPKK
jgi:hypothetical protein